MAIVTPGSVYPIDFRQLDVTGLLQGDVTTRTTTSLVVNYGGGTRDEFTGVNFSYSQTGQLTAGTITGYRQYIGGSLVGQVDGASASATQFMVYVNAHDTVNAVLYILNGDDTVNGTAFADYLAGGNGNDTLNGQGGDDILIGNSGNDTLNGGAGVDTALYGSGWANYGITRTSTGWTVTDRTGAVGTDTLIDVERISFSDKDVTLASTDAAVSAYLSNILRTNTDTGLSMSVANGMTTRADALAQIIVQADSTTTVATLSYQFFTGKIPTQAGFDFLISSTGPNTANLNSAYYAQFNTVNRFINFAVNLGKNGEAKDSFLVKYGQMSLFDATRDAYKTIFGVTPSDDKLHVLLDTRVDYLAYYGGDGATGIGTKAAMVGFLLAAAATENVGMYAKSSDAFLTDLSDGATFSVDLVGVYGKAEYANF